MTTPPLPEVAPLPVPTGSCVPSDTVKDDDRLTVRRDVEQLPDGRRITYYSSARS